MGRLPRYFIPPVLTLAAAILWLYFGKREEKTAAPDVSGGEYTVGDLRFDVPPTQKVFLNAAAAQTLTARNGEKRISGFNVLYRPANSAAPAPGASIALAFLSDSQAFAHDSWARDDGDGEKGGKFQRAQAAQPRSGGFYVYERKNDGSELLVSADCSTFFGAPATLARRKNGQSPGTGVDYEFEYLTSVALSSQVVLVVSFNDLALKDRAIDELLGGIEKDVGRWAAMAHPGQTLGRKAKECEKAEAR